MATGLAVALLLPALLSSAGGIPTVTVGVPAPAGEAAARWRPTVDYLNEELPGYRFRLRALAAADMERALAAGELDFVLTDPGRYVELEAAHGISRIATLVGLLEQRPVSLQAAVIITRADRHDIRTLADLRGHSFRAVAREAFAGFRMAWRELAGAGIDPFRDLSRLEFTGPDEAAIVQAVLDGAVDAGTVRAGLLERLIRNGRVRRSELRVLGARHHDGFPYLHSTPLYPQWSLARTARAGDALAAEVAVALLALPASHPAALQGDYAGWTAPRDDSAVHALFRDLRLGPYAGLYSLEAVVSAYGPWMAALGGALLALLGVALHMFRLNRGLKGSKRELEREVNERRRVQDELVKLSSALEQTADTVIITNRAGIIEYVNPAFEAVTGYSAREAIGRRPRFLKSGEHDDEFFQDMWRTILAGEVFHDLFINRRKDGSLVYEEKTITPLKNGDGEIVNFIATGKDVTEKRLAEQNSRQHQDYLAHVSRVSMMGEMASSIAHELNQPLAAITNYAQGCVRRLSSNDYRVGEIIAALQNISQQSKRSGEIIRRLRSFVAKGEPKRTRADINEIVQNAASLAYFEARKKGIILRLNLGENLPPVHADVIQIEQVILNLVRNAIEAMAKNLWNKRELRIHTWSLDQRTVEVAVWDTGHGLLPEDQKRVFDAFFTTKRDGMGMGLSISRSIIEAHGGTLTATNNQDQGATFKFSLPVLQEEDEVGTAARMSHAS